MNAPAATGTVIRWVDGDTVWVATRLRLTKSAAELVTSQGRAAHARMQDRYPARKEVRFVVRWVDSYGRIVAELQ